MKLADQISRAAETRQPLVMGIVNVTPDSFSDGGRCYDPSNALRHAETMANAGVDILDIGGESTRPGAESVSLNQELERVLPVIEAIKDNLESPVSIDSMKPEVIREAVRLGACMINDVNGLRAPDALTTAAELDVPVCIMHMQGKPDSMQVRPDYLNVVDEMIDFFNERIEACNSVGIRTEHQILDPGFGFGKTLTHNLELLASLERLASIRPLLVGISRKSMLGQITGHREAKRRVSASVAAALMAADRGAAIVRVHDVQETVDALKVRRAVQEINGDVGTVK